MYRWPWFRAAGHIFKHIILGLILIFKFLLNLFIYLFCDARDQTQASALSDLLLNELKS